MNTSIGENIKTMRRKCGFTQEELAARLMVTPQAVSKWENGSNMPDITQLVPLSQLLGITTDSLLGVVSATYGNAHTEAAINHVKLLMSTSQSAAEKHLAAYTYLRAESEKEPTNYTIMLKCINHAAEISRHVNFDSFMSDRPDVRDEIFEDCERKHLCISRYCEDKNTIEKSDFAMSWIYIHTKQFDKAKQLIDRLPSLESNMMKESIMMKLVHFQFGFERAKEVAADNIHKLMDATAKESFYVLESYSWFGDVNERAAIGRKLLGILDAYKAFDELLHDILVHENQIRKFMPRCYAVSGDIKNAGNELIIIAGNYKKIYELESTHSDTEAIKTDAMSRINEALGMVDENQREIIKETEGYSKAIKIIEEI